MRTTQRHFAVIMKSDEIIEKIRNKLKESDPDKRTVVNTFQFNFTDADGNLIKSMGEFMPSTLFALLADHLTIVFDFKALDIYEGKAPDADGRVTIADEDFYLVGTKQTTFESILQQEKAQVDGNTEAINKMLEKFRLNSQN